jgi:hypothetical protein
MSVIASSESSVAHDFDFWTGTWRGRNRRLRERLACCAEWDEFEGTCVARPLLSETRLWSIYWTDTRRSGLLEPPVIGSFAGGIGVFECDDTFDGRPIIVRYRWSDVTTTTARWAQAFSEDGGETWETNWTVEHSRVD